MENRVTKLINAFDENTWDEPETSYFKYVDEVVSQGTDERFSNGKPWHAVYLLFKFIEAAERSVRIFSGTLVRSTSKGVKIYGEPRVIDATCAFLRRPDTILRIALEQAVDAPGGDANKHPLVAAVRNLKACGDLKGTFELRRVDGKTTDSLRQRNVLHHMMLMDQRGWRIETDPNLEDVKAIVNANNSKETRSLCNGFDMGVWPHGETLVALTP